MFEEVGIDSATSRHLLIGDWRSLEYPESWRPSSDHFIVMIAANYRTIHEGQVTSFVNAALDAGACYFVCWGPECEELHDSIDEILVGSMEISDDNVILTTWHDQESLAYAVWFAINVAWPAKRYEDSCQSVVSVVIDNEPWAREVRSWLGDPRALSDHVCGSDEED